MPDVAADLSVARAWWEPLRQNVPPDVVGLWFGLFDAADGEGRGTRTLYVVGTANFDVEDETADWVAGEYVWESDGRYVVPVLVDLPADPYAVPLAHAAAVVKSFEPWRTLPGVGVAVRYDDGDCVVVHRG